MEIIIAVLGSGVLSALVSGGITLLSKSLDRKYANQDKDDARTEELDIINKRLHKAEVDNVRLQMLVLMSDYQDETAELMRVAEHYFKDLQGNWYMTTMFNRWIENNGIAHPDWLKKGE